MKMLKTRWLISCALAAAVCEDMKEKQARKIAKTLDALLELNERMEKEDFEKALVFLANTSREDWQDWKHDGQEEIPVEDIIKVIKAKNFMEPKIRGAENGLMGLV